MESSSFKIAAGVSLLLLVIAVLLGANPHAHFWYEFPGYGALLGLGGCWVIVVVSKAIGTLWLDRPENYYRDEGHD